MRYPDRISATVEPSRTSKTKGATRYWLEVQLPKPYAPGYHEVRFSGVCQPTMRRFCRLLSLFSLAALLLAAPLWSDTPPNSAEVIPVDQIRPGMQGCAYTIFAGDQVEKFDLEVLGVMPNFLGPKQSIILVQLKGPKVEHTGVVA